ncbi:MAG: 6-bladed beta-propeller [Verrucomicrobiota bacterium]
MSGVLFLDSLAVAAGATALSLGAGLVAAIALAGATGRFRALLMAVTLVNFALPPFLVANHWLDLTASWRATAAPGSLADGSWLLTALTLGALLWPVPCLLVMGAWSRLQSDLLESDPAVRGVPLLAQFLIPVARPELVLSAVVVATLSLANFTVPVLFQVRVFTEEFWIRFNTRLDATGALRATWPLLLVPVVVLAVFRGRSIAWPRWQSSAGAGILRSQLGVLWPVASGVTLLWMGFTVMFPLGRLVATGRTWLELPGAASAGMGALLNSVGTSAATATLVVAAGLAVAASGRRIPLRWLSWIPFLIPGVMTGVVLIALFNRPGLSVVYQSLAVVMIALVVRYLAVGGSLVESAVATADPAMSDAARTLGAGPWRVFRDTVWPQVAPACAAAWYLVYLLCLWDVESVVLIQPPGGETLALRIFNLLHYGHAAQVNSLCILLLGLALVPWLAWTLVRCGTSRGSRVALALFAILGAAGCGRNPESGGEMTPLQSKLFSGVTVLGSRGVSPGQFNKPRSLVCDRDDNLYVVDLTGRVQKFSPDGRYLLQWQMPETDLGKPKGMTLDHDGNVVVVEPHYMRVNHFTPGGHLVAQWGVKGTNVGEFILPRGIAEDSHGDFHVSEYTVVDRVQRFTLGPGTAVPGLGHCVDVLPAGTNHFRACPTAVWGSPGTENGQFNRAENVAVGPRDEVFVADSCNHRIQVFDRDGKFLRCHGRAGSHPGEFSYPYDIRVDASGNQYICEFGNSRITILDARDQVIEVVGGAGAAPGQFANPWSIALDSKGNLYIADSQNHRVQKLHRR